jgi:hypothetical protein
MIFFHRFPTRAGENRQNFVTHQAIRADAGTGVCFDELLEFLLYLELYHH